MKAKISSNRKNENNIVLSIGMIVKNEEKVLERCLKSLCPLMERIPSELIIADTGSTDSTVEIAKKYTDNVFHFEWVNNFAAARNSTLKKARGQWYLFIDADEYLDDDIGEIVHFFNIPELREKYKTLQIAVRSYSDEKKETYQDVMLSRFQRIDDKNDPVEFIGSVHETMYTRFPLGYFSTFIHHTGYCFSSAKQNIDKKNRNLQIMMQEYKNNPNDIRLVCHIIDGSFDFPTEIEKYIKDGLELIRKDRFDIYSNSVYIISIQYYEEHNPLYALDLCEEYKKTLPDFRKYVGTIAVELSRANILASLGKYEEAHEAFQSYFSLYKDYKDEKLDMNDAQCHPVMGLAEHEFIKSKYTSLLCLMKLCRYDEALDVLKNIDIVSLENNSFKEYLGTLREICKSKKEYSELAKCYSHVINCNQLKDQDEKISLSLYMLESTYYSLVTPVDRKKFAMDMVNSGVEGRYIELMRLILEQENIDFNEKLISFFETVDDWSDGYSEAIYLAVKHKVDISEYVSKMKSSMFRIQLEEIANKNDDFAGYVLSYGMPEGFTQSIKRFYWITSLFEKASYRCFELNNKDKYKLYMMFTNTLGEYVENIYNTELLNEEDIDVIPELHQFGYYMLKANRNLVNGDSIGYIKEMKNALKRCSSMNEIVAFLLEQFRKNNF